MKHFNFFTKSYFHWKKSKKNFFFKSLKTGIFHFEQFLNHKSIFRISNKFYSQFEYAGHENGLYFITRVNFRYPRQQVQSSPKSREPVNHGSPKTHAPNYYVA